MDAHVKTVREILHSGDQFLVPFFQRHYSWEKKEWETLLADIVALTQEEEQSAQHFLGPLVCTPFHPVPGEVTPYQLIDGQQRLVTITLALAALRDLARLAQLEDLAAEIHEDYLIHRRRQGLQRFKVVPSDGQDRACYEAVIDAKATGTTESSGILGAYSFFKRQWKPLAKDAGETAIRPLLIATTARLVLVVITITATADRENPFEIFESLNAKGLPLQEADLIRNYLFMQVPLDEQAEFHSTHWKPFEHLFEATAQYEELSSTLFYRSYLMREGSYCRNKAAYMEFKVQNPEGSIGPAVLVENLRRFAGFELWLRRPLTCLDEELREAFAMIQALDITTAHPLLLNLLDRYKRQKLSKLELLACLTDLASFVIRRSICGESTRGYGRLFPAAIEAIQLHVQKDLCQYWLSEGWPDNAAFVAGLVEFPIYKREREKCRLLLEELERRHGHKEEINLEHLSIEHVMPQTLGDDEDGRSWQTALGPDWRKLQEKWVHTLGNLTLTGYNPELGNASYAEKRAAFAQSKVSLNQYFVAVETWDDQAIRERGLGLARIVAQLWPRPEGGPIYVPPGPSTHEPERLRDEVPPPAELGEYTHEYEFYKPILETLIEMGGSGDMRDVLDRVEKRMRPQLGPADYQPLPSGANILRWRNTAQWARNKLKTNGYVKSNSPRFVWEITEAGRRFYQSARGSQVEPLA